MYRSKGFTLIELLVAISVLAIASAVGFSTYANAQIAGRDAKRKDDLRQVQTALELYYQSQTPTHSYPSGTTWAALGTALTGTPTYINTMPIAPTSASGYQYTYTPGSCVAGVCSTYDLCAQLENTNDPTYSGVTVGVIAGGGACGGTVNPVQRFFHLANP